MSVLRERVTVVWLGLMALTCVTTWGLSKDLFIPAVGVVGIFCDRCDEGQLRDAGLHGAAICTHSRYVVAFQAWPVIVAAMILGFWFATPSLT